jgi:hypothetical protein
MNATDATDPNDGWARSYNLAMGVEVTTMWPDTMNYPGTSDIVGANGLSGNNNSFQVDTQGFDAPWTDGVTEYVFVVGKDLNSMSTPARYMTGDVPNGYVASDGPITITTVPDPQETGDMTLEKIPTPSFSTTDGTNYTVNWTVMVDNAPRIGAYVILNSTSQTGPWSLFEEAASPPSTSYAISGQYYSLGINWTGGVMSIVQGAPAQFNTEPFLNWITGETNGVLPDDGPINCRDFEFNIEYLDTNNDAPGADPIVYVMENGVNITGSPFTMMEVDALDMTYNDGKDYTYGPVQLTNASATYTYYFEANDTFGTPAIGDGSMISAGPVVSVNTAPSIAISMPVSTDSWTGGTPHSIEYTITDAEDGVPPGFDLTLSLTYSTDGSTFNSVMPAGTAATGLGTYMWTVASIDSTTVRIYANVTDSCGVLAGGMGNEFEIDSTPPTVTFAPADAATDVAIGANVVMTFSEPMNTTSAEAAFSILPAVAGTFTWDVTNTILTFNPNSDFAQFTDYTVTVAATALDDSDPGNAMAADSATFKTQDLEAPVITHTPVTSGSVGVAITIAATVTDNVAVDEVKVNYIGVAGGLGQNMTMTLSSGDDFTFDIPAQTATGNVQYFIWAVDTAGNAAMTSTIFVAIGEETCTVSGTVTPGGALVEILDSAETVIGSATADANGAYTISGLPCGSYSVRASADGHNPKTQTVDTSTNPTVDIALTPTDEADFPWWIIIVLVVIIVVIVVLLLLMKKKKKPEEEAAPEEEAEEEAPEEELEMGEDEEGLEEEELELEEEEEE